MLRQYAATEEETIFPLGVREITYVDSSASIGVSVQDFAVSEVEGNVGDSLACFVDSFIFLSSRSLVGHEEHQIPAFQLVPVCHGGSIFLDICALLAGVGWKGNA